jgi:membrane protein
MLASFVILSVLFATIFKVVPDAHIGWKDVWIGAVVTSVFFTIGKYGLGFYLGRSGVTSAYGAAGSIVALVIWVYYSSQILLFGAELTQAYAHHCGSKSVTSQNSESKSRNSEDAGPGSNRRPA